MRLARVIGKVTLNERTAELPAGSYLLVRTQNRNTLMGRDAGNDETVVTYDNLAAREGDVIVSCRQRADGLWRRLRGG